jgi:hypothetical protein
MDDEYTENKIKFIGLKIVFLSLCQLLFISVFVVYKIGHI